MTAIHPDLATLADRYFHGQFRRFPSWGSAVGLSAHDADLEIISPELLADELSAVQDATRQVSALPDAARFGLSAKAFAATLIQRQRELQALRNHRRNLCHYAESAADCIFNLLVRRDLSQRAAVEAIASRMERIPAALEAAVVTADEPVELWTRLAVEAADGALDFFRGAIPPLAAQQDARLAERLTKASAAACEALTAFGRFCRDLLTENLDPTVACGEDVLRDILRHDHGLSISPAEAESWARTQMVELRQQLALAAERLEPGTPWHVQVERMRDAFAADVQPADLLARYKTRTARLRQRLIDERVLPLPPGEQCLVIPTPAFLVNVIPTAAYSNPGPMDARQVGLYFVTEPGAVAHGADLRAAVRQHAGLLLTSAHEAYPGHHVQLCWANQAPSLPLQLASHIIFMEGWTLYCEQMCVERGWIESPAEELCQVHDQLWRACRVVIDVGLHSGQLSVADCIETLVREVGFTRQRATAELNWYTQKPGTPMSYLLGKQQTLELRQRWHTRGLPDDGDDFAFHRWLLSHGSVPQTWLHDLMPLTP